MKLVYTFLCLAVALILCLSNSFKVFDYPPRSVHQWRQSDCAAYVKTYYRTGASLLKPATFNLAGKEGRVVSEFPVLYYCAAKIQQVTGEHYWVVRGITFGCYLIGLIALLACVRIWIKNPAIALFPVLILATSPYYYYYAINFLPNVPAISFSFAGLYFFLKYRQKPAAQFLAAGTFFFMLSTALKPTDGGLLWLAFIATDATERLLRKDKDLNKKTRLWPYIVSSLIIIISILGWTEYVNWYNDQNGNHQNLIGIYPIWDMDRDLIKYTVTRVTHEWSNVFQQKLILQTLPFLGIIFIWKWKQLHHFLKWFTIWTFLGAFLYSILWFKAYTDHDYYQLPLIFPPLLLTITILQFLEKESSRRSISATKKNIGYGVLVLLVSIGIYHNRNIQSERYTKPDYVYVNPALYEIEPYLKGIGVTEKDAVVCVPDKSPNISLNAINHYGYTEEFNNDYYNITIFKKQGAAYLLVSDSSYLNNPLYMPFLDKKIGEYKGIYVFDLR